MKVGLQFLGGSVSPKRFAQSAEQAGFDSVWVGDHVAHYVDAVSTVGCFAGCTETITVGTNVLVAPFRPAVVTAKAIATTARLAEGRFVAGIGVGGDFPEEFVAAGADMRTRGAFTEELLTLLPELVSGRPVTFEGRWTTMTDFVMDPPPPRPTPVWVGGRADVALRRAVERADGYLGYLLSAGGLASRVDTLSALAGAAGTERPTVACNLITVPGRSVPDSLDVLAGSSLDLSGINPDVAQQVMLLGDQAAMLARVEEYTRAGLDHVILGCPPSDERGLGEFIAATRDVLSELRALR